MTHDSMRYINILTYLLTYNEHRNVTIASHQAGLQSQPKSQHGDNVTDDDIQTLNISPTARRRCGTRGVLEYIRNRNIRVLAQGGGEQGRGSPRGSKIIFTRSVQICNKIWD